MLDPRVQKKGGFGAFVDRENARGNAEEAARNRTPSRTPPESTVTPIGDAPSLAATKTQRPTSVDGTTLAERTGDRPLPVDTEPRQ